MKCNVLSVSRNSVSPCIWRSSGNGYGCKYHHTARIDLCWFITEAAKWNRQCGDTESRERTLRGHSSCPLSLSIGDLSPERPRSHAPPSSSNRAVDRSTERERDPSTWHRQAAGACVRSALKVLLRADSSAGLFRTSSARTHTDGATSHGLQPSVSSSWARRWVPSSSSVASPCVCYATTHRGVSTTTRRRVRYCPDINTACDKPKHKPSSHAAAHASRLRAHRSPLRYRCRLRAVVCEEGLR